MVASSSGAIFVSSLDRSAPYVRNAGHEAALKKALAPAHAELGAGEVPDPLDLFGRFDSQVAIVLEERVPVLSSHFGAPDATTLRALKANGTRVIATATTIDEACQLEAAVLDAVIAQGSEAGGHCGSNDAWRLWRADEARAAAEPTLGDPSVLRSYPASKYSAPPY
jgi:NAD(P)H-dependent flavin oxidoreductase YrpB (nitropropane dioxygenase family)